MNIVPTDTSVLWIALDDLDPGTGLPAGLVR